MEQKCIFSVCKNIISRRTRTPVSCRPLSVRGQVGTVGQARTAVEMGASAVVAQGREAGGHGLRYDGRVMLR